MWKQNELVTRVRWTSYMLWANCNFLFISVPCYGRVLFVIGGVLVFIAQINSLCMALRLTICKSFAKDKSVFILRKKDKWNCSNWTEREKKFVSHFYKIQIYSSCETSTGSAFFGHHERRSFRIIWRNFRKRSVRQEGFFFFSLF